MGINSDRCQCVGKRQTISRASRSGFYVRSKTIPSDNSCQASNSVSQRKGILTITVYSSSNELPLHEPSMSRIDKPADDATQDEVVQEPAWTVL